MRFEPGLFLLHQHLLGNVDEHRACVGAAGVGPRPPLHPERFAVVFASQLQHHAARVDTLADGGKRFLQTPLCVRSLGNEISAIEALNLIRRDAQRFHRCAVGTDEFGIEAFMDVGDRRFVEEIAQPFLALGQRLFRLAL